MKRLELLDYARFVATLCVLNFHYLFNGINNGKISSITYIDGIVDIAKYGYLGVEFFFMASGYVIYLSLGNKSAGQFIAARITRLYPVFWAAVILTSCFTILWGGPMMSVTLPQFLANLTMLPSIFGYGYVDGVYWTLEFELRFYLLVLFFLIVGLRRRLNLVFMLWPVLMLAAFLFELQHLPYMGGYYCFFATGVLFAILRTTPSKIPVIPLMICLYLCITFSCGKALGFTQSKGFAFSPFVIDAIIAAQFLFFLLLNTKKSSHIVIPGSRTAGDLSYPLFLIHAHLGYMFISQFATNTHRLLFYGLTWLVILSIAVVMHRLIEKQGQELIRDFFMKTIGEPVDALIRIIAGQNVGRNHS